MEKHNFVDVCQMGTSWKEWNICNVMFFSTHLMDKDQEIT